MAEARRVHLTTLARYVPPSSFTSDAREAAAQPDRPADTDTVRLVLTLFEPDEQSFPEFSYAQLVAGKQNGTEDKDQLSRLEDRREKDEAAALAAMMEEKYGSKARKSDRIQDLIDIGYGYDEDDSFIDNTEPYDEFVPASLTTMLGGFYVNSGVLQFRLTSDPEEASRPQTAKAPKKRKLNLGQEKPKKKVCRQDKGMKTDGDPETSTPSAAKVKKRRKKTSATLSVTSMLKKFQREKEKRRQKEAAAPPCPADGAGGGASGLTDPLLSLIGSADEQELIQAASAVDLDIDLDSLLEASEAQPAADLQLFLPRTDEPAQAPPPGAPPQPKPHADQTGVCLPGGVPAGLAAAIERLAVAARTSEGESKLKFFTPEINSILLDIELQCREHGGQLRSKVYTHLSSFLPCSRDTVLKRVKRLLLAHTLEVPERRFLALMSDSAKEEPPGVEGPLQKLKEAVGRAMPEQIARFRQTCHLHEQVKSSRAAEEENDVRPKLNPAAEDNLEERGAKRGPRKMFRWTEEIRECLSLVLQTKLEEKEKSSQELEDFLKALLENEVKPLWPKGWMQSRVLMMESRKLLGLLPSLLVKKVRAEKKQPLSGAPAAPSDRRPLQGSPQKTWTKPERRSGGMEVAAGPSTPAGSAGRPPARSAPAGSLQSLLAHQALAQEPPLAPQELLASRTHLVKNWSFALDTDSPPPPPPPPQSSPVEVPVSGVYHLLPLADLARRMGAAQTQWWTAAGEVQSTGAHTQAHLALPKSPDKAAEGPGRGLKHFNEEQRNC